VKDLSNENYKFLKKEIRHYKIEKTPIFMAKILKSSYKFIAISIKIPMSVFTEIEKSQS
jgi:hypothetical protein